MAHMEPMDVDNDFDDKENSLQNSNVLPRTPSTEKGYEELDVSELNMKLRYSMTPATSPMSRSFTTNYRDNKVCDNENNSINTMYNDNSNLTHSFNSTITDSIHKSPKFPLQVLPTEQFVDDNGNPIVRSLDVECNKVTITVDGTDNIDDNLSLPSTSSSLAHTPEATTPTKEIPKDGGSPIMRGLKSVLNMFRSSQSPIPSDDIATNDLNPFESQKKAETSNLTTYLGSTPTTTSKNNENISKTNSPLKESLVFNEDLEKELLWKDETTILFKEEKIPVYKLFFPPNSAALESLHSKTIEKKNINTTVEYMDGSFNETLSADKDMTEVVKSSSLETETVNSPESDSEFLDCETSYTKNDTRILDDNIRTLSPIKKNMLPEFSITDGNTFQPNETVGDENLLSIMADTDLAKQTNAIKTNTQSVIKKADNDEKQTIHNELPTLRDFLDEISILSNTLIKDIPNDLDDKCNTIVHENLNELVQCSNETFNLEKSETKDLQIDKEYNNDITNTSDIVNNEVTLGEEDKEDFKEFCPSQITNETEDIYSGEIVCDFDSTIVLKEQADTLKINNIKLSLDYQVVNKVGIDSGVLQDKIITMNKNIVMPLVKCEKAFNADNKCNVQLGSEIIEDTTFNNKHNETETFISDQSIQLETKHIKNVNYNLPSDIPLPCDSDIDKDNVQDIIEENSRDNDKAVNISSNNLNVDLPFSTESIKQTIDGMTTLTKIHSEPLPYPTINNIVANTSIIQTSQLALSEDMSTKITYLTVNESDVPEIYNTEKCISLVRDDTKDISSKIIHSVIPSNDNDSVSGIDLDVTHQTQDNKNIISQNHDDFVQTSKSTDVENETVLDVKIQYDEVSHSSTNNKIVTGMVLDVSRHDIEVIENPFETKNKLTASFEVQHNDSVSGDVFPQNPVESVPRVAVDKNYITNEMDVRVQYDEVDIPITNINTSGSGNDLDVTRLTQNNMNVISQNHNDFVQTSKSTDVENETVIDAKIQYDELSFSSTNNKAVTGMVLNVSKHDIEDIENPFETKNKLTASFEVQHNDSVIGDVFLQNPVESVPQVADDKNDMTNKMDVRIKYDEVNVPITNINTSGSGIDLDVTRQTQNNIDVFSQNHNDFVQSSKSTDVENETVLDVKIQYDEVSLSSTNNKIVTEMELDVSKHDIEDIENPFETKNKLTASFEVQHNDSVSGDVFPQNPVESVPRVAVDKNYITNEMDVRVQYDEVDIPITNINTSGSGNDLDVTRLTQNNMNVISQNHNDFVQTSKSTDVENETVIDAKIQYDELSFSSTNNKAVTGMVLNVSKHDIEDIENPFETKNKLTASFEVQHNDSVIGDVFLQNPVESVPQVADDKNDMTNKMDVRIKYDEVNVPITNINTSGSGIDLDVTRQTQNNIDVFSQNHNDFVQSSKSTDVENETVLDVKIQYDEVSLSSTNNKIVTEMELDVSKHDIEDIENPFKTKNKLTTSLEVQRCDSVSGDVFLQNPVESVPQVADDKNDMTNKMDVRIKYDEVNVPITNINTSGSGIDLDVTRQTQNNIDVFSQNHNDFVQSSKSTDVENETVLDVKIQYDEVSLSSTNNKIVTEMELDVSKHDIEDIENPFKTKNKLTTSLEVQRCDSVIEDIFPRSPLESVPRVANDKNYITNEMDVRVKYDDVDIPITNINTSVIGMDLDVSDDSENIEIPDSEITIKSDVTIKEHVSLPSSFNNSLVIEMELDVSKPDLEDVTIVSRRYRNSIDTKKQRKSSSEEQGRESVIENTNAKKYFENIFLDDCNLIRNENDLNITEVITIPTKSNNSVTEMELDVSKHDLTTSENTIKASCQDRDIEDCENKNKAFKSISKLIDERLELTSKSDVTINNELNFPSTKEISEIDLGVSKYDEENIETTFETKGFTPLPEISSKLTQDGYSIDFDEIDDPFNIKTNSPTFNKSRKDYQMRPEPNRRKTLQNQKISTAANEDANASFGVVKSCLENVRAKEIYFNDGEKPDFIEKNINSAPLISDKIHDYIEMNIPGNCTFVGQIEKTVEDKEIHLSNKISSSSSKNYKTKNVFNLPELNDKSFKPFTTTSNINDNQRTSSDVCYTPLQRTVIESAEAEKNVQDLASNISPNLSNVTCSSKNTDDVTSFHVNTEDEDTVEGPFLEAEDFADIVKVSDIETEKDMMNFEDLPTRTNDDNDNGEFFIDAEAFEFLLNQNKSNVVADSGKESLFLKFDPLFAKRISSDGVLAALNKIQKRQSTPKKLTPLKIMHEENPTPGPSTKTPIGLAAPVVPDNVEEPVVAMSKPMMVVNPAIATFVSPRKSSTPPKVNRRSLTFTSPAMAVIDRLLSLSGNSSNLDQDSSLPISREYNETDYALTQLRELLADKEIHVSNLRSESKELKERFAILESQVRSLETESEERLRKVTELNENLAEKNKINKSMAIVVEEYERTIASLIAEMEQEKKHNAEERMKLINERDEQTAHLTSMEVSFSDLHSKYEKSKQIILSMKANEDTYKKSLNEFEVNLLKMQTNYELLKQHATSKLNHANQELEKYNRAHDAEVLKLNAMIKRKELHITSLEESLSQKTKANEELTAICDELINKVG